MIIGNMEIDVDKIMDFLISTQEYTEDEVAEMPIEELVDLYEMYMED